MSHDPTMDLLEAHLLDESCWLSVHELCRLSDLTLEIVIELADLGAIEPRGYTPEEWQLPATLLPRLRAARRLIRDLGVNTSGAALALELLDAQRELERRVRRLERLMHEGG